MLVRTNTDRTEAVQTGQMKATKDAGHEGCTTQRRTQRTQRMRGTKDEGHEGCKTQRRTQRTRRMRDTKDEGCTTQRIKFMKNKGPRRM